jgi:S-DNA-T family DNA segregation ATPase FtsK/SpoIIIE
VLIFLTASTIIGDSLLVGEFGIFFSKYNRIYFGYLSFIYLLFFIYPLYVAYKSKEIRSRVIEIFLSIALLLFIFLILQSLLSDSRYSGKAGEEVIRFLTPHIGVAGIWIFWIMGFTMSTIIIFNISVEEALGYLFKKRTIPKLDMDRFKTFKETFMLNARLPDIKFDNLMKPKEKPIKPQIKKPIKSYKKDNKELKFEEEYYKILTEDYNLQYDIENNKLNIEQESKLIDIDKNNKKVENNHNKKYDNIEINTESNHMESTSLADINLTNHIENQLSISQKTETLIGKNKKSTIKNEVEENKKLLSQLDTGKSEKPKDFILPKIEFLSQPKETKNKIDEGEIDKKIAELLEKLKMFKINGDVVRTYAGPLVTTFEFKPTPDVKVSKILNLQDDLAMALKASTIRIQAPIPGKDVVGIEVPNSKLDTIYLREILESELFNKSISPLTICLGKDIVGKPFITDLKKLPHLLIAGTTGSGKSVGINSMIMSLLYKNSPKTLRLILIDPKMLEFSIYDDIPHLITPVITKAKEAILVLNNMVKEMERRYTLMSQQKVKNIDGYNEKAKKNRFDEIPFIVIIIDELADLMMTSGKDVEYSIARLAQMARASGIHLIVATQRPSVDVVTGLIKANLPSRISYRVGQKIDSKVILDQYGADSLLGRGDMLFTPPGSVRLVRLHAPWCSEDEIEKVVEFLKSQQIAEYDNSFLRSDNQSIDGGNSSKGNIENADELLENARQIVITDKKTSISYIQRKLQIGYNRAARIIEQLELDGLLSAPNTKGIREILND